MDGNKYRVEVSTDEYTCIQITNDDTTLVVEESLPTANQVEDVILCDDNSVGDDTDGFIGTFDFTNLIVDILGQNQSTDDFTVTFHLSQDDANNIANSGIVFPFSNTQAFNQTVHVRVLSNKTELKTELPIILVGDFNASAKMNKTYDILVDDGGFEDTIVKAKESINAGWNTINGFRETRKGSRRIDWVLSKGGVKTLEAEIVLFDNRKQYPSDHQPVSATIVLEK